MFYLGSSPNRPPIHEVAPRVAATREVNVGFGQRTLSFNNPSTLTGSVSRTSFSATNAQPDGAADVPLLVGEEPREQATRLGVGRLDQGRDDDRGRQQHQRAVAREAQKPQSERRLRRGPTRGFGARPNGCGAPSRAGCRARPEQSRGHRVEGCSPQQQVFSAREARRSQLRVLPYAAEAPSEQRREHGGKVRRLEARPGLVEDPPALLLVAYAAYCRIEGDLPGQCPAEPRREAEIVCYLPGSRRTSYGLSPAFRVSGIATAQQEERQYGHA